MIPGIFDTVGGIMQGTCIASCRNAQFGINEENGSQSGPFLSIKIN